MRGQIGIGTNESPRQPRTEAREQTLSVPLSATGPWMLVCLSTRPHVDPQRRADSRLFFQQSACDSKLYHVPLYRTPTASRVSCRDRMYTCMLWRLRLAVSSMHRSIKSGLGGKYLQDSGHST